MGAGFVYKLGFTGTKKRGVPDGYFVLCTATAKFTGFHRSGKSIKTVS